MIGTIYENVYLYLCIDGKNLQLSGLLPGATCLWI